MKRNHVYSSPTIFGNEKIMHVTKNFANEKSCAVSQFLANEKKFMHFTNNCANEKSRIHQQFGK